MQKIFKDELFSTPVFKVNILQHINQLNQLTDPYIKDSINKIIDYYKLIKITNDNREKTLESIS